MPARALIRFGRSLIQFGRNCRFRAFSPFPQGLKPDPRAISPVPGPSAQSHPRDFARGAVPVRPRS
eukprot:6205218-Alexandrium_andersonii.AAC.1